MHAALSAIDVQLKMRSDLIPNILTIANEYMKYERSLLVRITELRVLTDKAYDRHSVDEIKNHLDSANELSGKIGELKFALENYPTLKSDRTMTTAMKTYNEVEAQIAAARRFYNSAVVRLDNAVQIFPGSIIAELINIQAMPFFTAQESEKEPVNAKQFFT